MWLLIVWFLQSKQFRNPAVKIGQVICFHVNKVNMDNKVLKFRAVTALFVLPSSNQTDAGKLSAQPARRGCHRRAAVVAAQARIHADCLSCLAAKRLATFS